MPPTLAEIQADVRPCSIADPYSWLANAETFDLEQYLAGLDARLLAKSEGRKVLTNADPFLFALTYLRHHLMSEETGLSYGDCHLDWFRYGRQWMIKDPGLRGWRHSFASPRSSGKSTIWYLMMPVWAASHGHKRFVASFANGGTQAEMHLQTFRSEAAENERLRFDFPELCTAIRKPTGRTVADNEGHFQSQSGFVWVARGIDVASLGMKVGNVRPDVLICHQLGTPMLHEDGRWAPVEEHGSFRGERIDNSREVATWGLPFTEKVTYEHRYWAKLRQGVYPFRVESPQWVEAKDLQREHFIGYTIDRIEEPAPEILVRQRRIGERDGAGRMTGGSIWGWERQRPAYLDDPEFWWFVGLWWGDGHISGENMLGVTINEKHETLRNRLVDFLARMGKSATIVPKSGCVQAVFSWTDMNAWLRTWRKGMARKEPPPWVERLPLDLQRALIEGYTDADGYRTEIEHRITSIHLPGLLAVRRILARLGHAATIRKGAGPRQEKFPDGRISTSQQKYDIRWSMKQDRYLFTRTHIEGDMLWSKIRSNVDGGQAAFAPIKTESGTYHTAFGLSHNCDDIEKDEAQYSPYEVEKRRKTLIDAIMPLNERAALVLVGTVTRPGSINHQLVKVATGEVDPESEEGEKLRWIRDERIIPHYYPPLVERGDGTRRSIWPAKWTAEYLESIEHTVNYQKNFKNNPRAESGDYWREADIRYNAPPADLPRTRRFMFVDPPTTMKTRSDPAGICVLSYLPGTGKLPTAEERIRLGEGIIDRESGERVNGWRDTLTREEAESMGAARLSRVVVEHAEETRATGTPLKRRLVALLERFPDVEAVLIEVNQGGDLWIEVMTGLPCKVITFHSNEPKEVRIKWGLEMYQRYRVTHRKRLVALEDQQTAYPRIEHDDIVDAVATGCTRLLKPRKKTKDHNVRQRF